MRLTRGPRWCSVDRVNRPPLALILYASAMIDAMREPRVTIDHEALRGERGIFRPMMVAADGGMSVGQLNAWASKRRRSRQTHRRKRGRR